MYRISVVNQGSAKATSVKVTAKLPQELEFVKAEGPTKGELSGGNLNFQPVAELGAKEKVEWWVTAKATKEGDVRMHVEATMEGLKAPAVAMEPTRLFGQQEARRPGADEEKR